MNHKTHTPAPWMVKMVRPGLASIQAASPHLPSKTQTIAEIQFGPWEPRNYAANVRLIAAAPELLRALKCVVPYAENEVQGLWGHARDGNEEVEREARRGQLAIRNAEKLIRLIEKGTK